MDKSVAIQSLGCRLNYSEGSSLIEKFQANGYKVVEFGSPADVTIINTCTVTDSADSRCRNLIRKSHEVSPEGKIVVTGCYAQMSPKEIEKIPGVDLIVGTHQKDKIFEYLHEESTQNVYIDKTDEFWGAATSKEDSRTRAFLKIQDGCNYVCSYCIIPFARGRSRTITIQKAVEQAHKIVTDGYKEIVLTGVNIGEYESSSNEKLYDLVNRILDIPGLERLRLGSVEPNTFNEKLLQVLSGSPKACNHFHVPLQSGCDKILKDMRRKYSSHHYLETLSMIQSYFPNSAFGADIIVGYPGETEDDFFETRSFLENSPITHFHVFPFSKRKLTQAAKKENQVSWNLKSLRSKNLIELGEAKLSKFSESLIGKTEEVLFESKHSAGFTKGYTKSFVKVFVRDENLEGKILKTRISEIQGDQLIGHLEH